MTVEQSNATTASAAPAFTSAMSRAARALAEQVVPAQGTTPVETYDQQVRLGWSSLPHAG